MPSHPSAEALDRIVADVATLADVPALLLWGPSDPVFSDIYLRDLEARLPGADVHRFVGASHLVSEEADVAGAVHEWVAQLHARPADRRGSRRRRADAASCRRGPALDRRAGDTDVAMIEMTEHGVGRVAQLRRARRRRAPRGGRAWCSTVSQQGDRVALLDSAGHRPHRVPVRVLAHGGGRRARRRGSRCARHQPRAQERDAALPHRHPRALDGRARCWGGPGERISAGRLTPARRASARRLDARWTRSARRGDGRPAPPTPADSDPAAVVFTSGATGPAKGVSYRHHQLQAQRDVLAARVRHQRPTTDSSPRSRPSRSTAPRWGCRRSCPT